MTELRLLPTSQWILGDPRFAILHRDEVPAEALDRPCASIYITCLMKGRLHGFVAKLFVTSRCCHFSTTHVFAGIPLPFSYTLPHLWRYLSRFTLDREQYILRSGIMARYWQKAGRFYSISCHDQARSHWICGGGDLHHSLILRPDASPASHFTTLSLPLAHCWQHSSASL